MAKRDGRCGTDRARDRKGASQRPRSGRPGTLAGCEPGKILLAALACTVAACSSGVTATGTQTAPPPAQVTLGTGATGTYPAAAWPEFGQNAARTGIAAGLPAAGPLSQRWTAHLDGAVYGQPLVVGNTVIAATENDSVYALNASTGSVVWRHHLGTPVPRSSLQCGDIDPLGITGTPVYDQGNGLVYAVAETTGYHHVLFGLAVSDGAIRVQRDIDIATAGNHPSNDQQRPALAIDGGRVYAAFGGLAGDCGTYIGFIVGVPLSGSGPLVSWHAPTTREGAIWATGGPVTGPDGDLWVSTGNGAAENPAEPYDGSDSVVKLTPNLVREDFFAPATWADDNANDRDLGSTQPVLAAGNSVLIIGKRGVGYLLNESALGGIGHQLAEQTICGAFGGCGRQRVHGLRAVLGRRPGGRLCQRRAAEHQRAVARPRRQQRVAGRRRRRRLGDALRPWRVEQRQHAVRARPGDRRGQASARDRRGAAALLVAVARGRHGVPRHPGRGRRRQRGMRGRWGVTTGPFGIMILIGFVRDPIGKRQSRSRRGFMEP